MAVSKYALPNKIDDYLSTLSLLYERRNKTLLHKIVVNGRVSIHEEWDYDNWDGGTYGHAITFSLPADMFLEIFDEKEELQSQLVQDINELDNSPNEQISAVFIEIESQKNERWREESAVHRGAIHRNPISDKGLQRIWGEGEIRVFLSHKTSVKGQTSQLKEYLSKCGVASFVAHDDIEPSEEWHKEIENALFSMDALIALLTVDYHESNWTDQEVGVALGRGVPVITIKLGCDPYGLMGTKQALNGCSLKTKTDIEKMAAKVFKLLYKHIPSDTLFSSAVKAYGQSLNFADSAWCVRNSLSIFDSLTENQVSQVLSAYEASRQNYQSYNGRATLIALLSKWTGKEWYEGEDGKLLTNTSDSHIPF